MITQEFVHGEPFMTAFEWDQDKKDDLAEILFRFFYGSLNRFEIFSADPHPGNYLLLPDGKVAFIDYGLVRSIDPGTLINLLEIVQALIHEDKERCRRALEGVGVLNQRTPEINALWEHLKMINKPVLEDREFKISAALVQKIATAGFDPRSDAFQTLRKVGIPGIMITFNRMSFGVASLLGRLEATRNWQAIARELWEGAPGSTRLGKLEEKWVAEYHPDWVPPLKTD